MKAEKALELVGRYARLTNGIKEAKAEIGRNLDKCKGLSGKRGQLDDIGCWITPPEMDGKNREKDLHIWSWYQPEYTGDGYYTEGRLVYEKVTADEHGKQCPHCYAAHLAIQSRKAMRRQLGAVKAAMTRGGAV